MDALTALQRLGLGNFIDDLHEQITQVSDKVKATGNPGAVTVKLTIAPFVQGGERCVVIEETYSQKVPSKKARGAVFFVGENGELFREDPAQPPLEGFHAIEVIDHETGEIITLDDRIEREV